MACKQLCRWNFDGMACLRPIDEICPMSNMASQEKPQTNADRIRAMSDEELEKHLHDIGWDCHLCSEHRRLDNEPLMRGEKCDEKCVEHCLQWLKQHVKESEE